MKNFLLAIPLLLATVSACKPEYAGENKMQKSTIEMKARCVGRHMMDLPSGFSLSSPTTGFFKLKEQRADGPAIEVTVHTAQLTPTQVAREVKKRSGELKDASGSTVDIFRLEKALNDRTTLFRVQRIDDAYVSELDFLSGATWVTAELKSYRNQFLAAEDTLERFAAAFKDNGNGLEHHGFCLGPVVVLGDFKEERANFMFENGLEKGVDFEIAVDTYREDEPKALLARVSGSDSLLSKFSLQHSVLRARELTVAGMRAEEWLGSADLGEQQSEKSLKFVLETMRPSPEKMKPSIHLTFETGQPLEDGSAAPTIMSDEDAIRLWDSVVRSLRPLGP